MLRRDPGEDGDGGYPVGQFGIAHGVERGGRHRLAVQRQLSGDCSRRRLMVAGDHLHPNTGFAAHPDRRASLGPRRILDPDQSLQTKFGEMRIEGVVRLERVGAGMAREATASTRSPLLGHGFELAIETGSGGRIERGVTGRVRQHRAPPDQHLAGALDEQADLPVFAVEGRHVFLRGIERNLGYARQLAADPIDIDTGLRRQRHERPLGRIADQPALVDAAVVADRGRHQEAQQIIAWRRRFRGSPPPSPSLSNGDPPVAAIPFAVNGVAPAA